MIKNQRQTSQHSLLSHTSAVTNALFYYSYVTFGVMYLEKTYIILSLKFSISNLLTFPPISFTRASGHSTTTYLPDMFNRTSTRMFANRHVLTCHANCLQYSDTKRTCGQVSNCNAQFQQLPKQYGWFMVDPFFMQRMLALLVF